jgi:hypothetical protein
MDMPHRKACGTLRRAEGDVPKCMNISLPMIEKAFPDAINREMR